MFCVHYNKVLVCREKTHANRIGEWLGLLEVHAVDTERKPVFVRGTAVIPARKFNMTKGKRQFTLSKLSTLNSPSSNKYGKKSSEGGKIH